MSGGKTMSVGYVSYAAPLATTAASLGARPVASTAAHAVGNAAVATGFDAAPAASAVIGGGAATTMRQAAASVIPAQPAAPTAAEAAAVSTVAGQFGQPLANDFQTAASGGGITEVLSNGISKITAFASNGMKKIEQAIQADMAANNGQVDAAKMQQYSMQMTTFQQIMEMAKKIQDSKDRAMDAWIR